MCEQRNRNAISHNGWRTENAFGYCLETLYPNEILPHMYSIQHLDIYLVLNDDSVII